MPKNTKCIVFDSGPIISLVMNNLLWILEDLERIYDGDFIITPAVKKELVDKPIATKKFKFEALQVLSYMKKDVLRLTDMGRIRDDALKLLECANHIFKAKGNWIRIVSFAEMEAIACGIHHAADAVVVDERTTRMLLEDSKNLLEYMENKLHTTIQVDRKNLLQFKKMARGLRLIRSTELVLIAYELGLLDAYLPDIPESKKQLLQAALWGVKLNGCAVSQEEIDTIIMEELKRR